MALEANGRARTLLTDRPELYEARFPIPSASPGDGRRTVCGGTARDRVCWTWAAAPAVTPAVCTRRGAG